MFRLKLSTFRLILLITMGSYALISYIFVIKSVDNDAENYTIKTKGCTIVKMYPFGGIMKNYHREKHHTICQNAMKPLLKRNRTHIWVVKENMGRYNVTTLSCCCQKFYRPNSVQNVWARDVDDRVKYESCSNFTHSIYVNFEFAKVTCYQEGIQVYVNMFLFAHKKVLRKYNNEQLNRSNKSNYNVVVLGIDNVSRMHFHRSMPKTLNILTDKGAVELRGYTKVGWNTYPNIVPILAGYSINELAESCHPYRHATFDFCPFIWNRFKNLGYYTAFGEDSASSGTFNYLADGFIRSPTDYYIRTFTKEAEKTFKTKVCLKENYFYEIMLNYVKDLLWITKNLNLFAFFWEISMTHLNFFGPIQMDYKYSEFFKQLDTALYENTIFFIISDHGARMGSIRTTGHGRLEERLPAAFILTPPSFRTKHKTAYNNLKMNAGRLTSPYDIHRTLVDLLDMDDIDEEKRARAKFNSKNKGISLFAPIPTNRTCKSAGIDEEWCACKGSSDEGNTVLGETRLWAARTLVTHLNKTVSGLSMCSPLKLRVIIDVTEIYLEPYPKRGQRDFLVVVITKPGDGMFEGVVRIRPNTPELVSMVRRINVYGQQSRCVDDANIKPYCYCI